MLFFTRVGDQLFQMILLKRARHKGLADDDGRRAFDPQRLRQVVSDDLLQEKLLDWLESNSTISEKAAAEAGDQA